MTKADLIGKIAQQAELSKSNAQAALHTVLENIEGELASGNKLTFVGFGTFSVSRREARTGRNPQTGKELHIPACNVVKFKPGKALKEAVK